MIDDDDEAYWNAIGDPSALARLIADGVRLTDWSLIGYAVGHCREEIVDILLDAFPERLDAFDDDLGWSPLMYATKAGNVGIIRHLLERGADVDAHDEAHIGNTALAEAIGDGNYEAARLLIEYGADPSIPGWMGLTAIDRAKPRVRSPEFYELVTYANAIASAARMERLKKVRKQKNR